MEQEASQTKLTIGQRAADRIAAFGGSWAFISSFLVFMAIWICINTFSKSYDPYPFILLNLVLSCIAALQAPLIMMSQNRQEQKDHERAIQDYAINVRAEEEIAELHEKLDRMLEQLDALTQERPSASS